LSEVVDTRTTSIEMMLVVPSQTLVYATETMPFC
jgi:hypothetical protein